MDKLKVEEQDIQNMLTIRNEWLNKTVTGHLTESLLLILGPKPLRKPPWRSESKFTEVGYVFLHIWETLHRTIYAPSNVDVFLSSPPFQIYSSKPLQTAEEAKRARSAWFFPPSRIFPSISLIECSAAVNQPEEDVIIVPRPLQCDFSQQFSTVSQFGISPLCCLILLMFCCVLP